MSDHGKEQIQVSTFGEHLCEHLCEHFVEGCYFSVVLQQCHTHVLSDMCTCIRMLLVSANVRGTRAPWG